jgi:SAM-dependent methyltransferase
MARYEEMYKWNPATEHYYANANIGRGQTLVDFGCGPGHAAIEFAKIVGEAGHVHALDINEEFVRRARTRALDADLQSRITVQLLTEPGLPLPEESVDRVVVRNTVIYVDDPVATFAEFHRVLRPEGLAHAIEGDWRLTAVEPVPTAEWRAIIEAASWAWPWPEIGRGLYGFARRGGFEEVLVDVRTTPDTSGRLRPMVQTVADYARQSGRLAEERIDRALRQIDEAIAEGTYLAIAPQFIVTASK